MLSLGLLWLVNKKKIKQAKRRHFLNECKRNTNIKNFCLQRTIKINIISLQGKGEEETRKQLKQKRNYDQLLLPVLKRKTENGKFQGEFMLNIQFIFYRKQYNLISFVK